MLDLPISRRIVQLYRSCWNSRIHLIDFISNQRPSILINSNKIFDFWLCFKGIRCNKLEIDFNIGGRWLGPLDLVTHPDTNPVRQSLTFANRREPVFSKGNSHQLFCHISFSKEEQFSSKFIEESFFCVPNYISISLQVTCILSNNENNKFN